MLTNLPLYAKRDLSGPNVSRETLGPDQLTECFPGNSDRFDITTEFVKIVKSVPRSFLYHSAKIHHDQ
jgi:hypothetical protein